MKRDWNHLDLSTAFHPIPEACSQALMEAARSAVQKKRPKRVPYRIVFAAALVLLCTAAMAYAITQQGWAEFLGQQFGISISPSAQEALHATQPVSYQVGPMTFTFQQLLADGHMGLSAAQVHLTDGSKALYADSADDAVPEEVLASYDLSWGGSWFEAAQELQLPLYSVRALLELPAAYSAESMEGALWQEDGSITYFSMPLLASVPSQSEIPATLYMQVTQYDPFSQSVLATWQAQEDISLPMTPMLAEKTYLPTQETYFEGLKLENVQGASYATGIYFTAQFTAQEHMTDMDAQEVLNHISILDEAGCPLPQGMNLSVCINTQALPKVTMERSTSLEAFPDQLTVSMDEVEAAVR